MPTGKKIDITDYEFIGQVPVMKDNQMVRNPITGEPETERKATLMCFVEYLTGFCQNPNLGAPMPGQPQPGFDLYKLGSICRQIDLAFYKNLPSVILSSEDYELLKQRVEVLCKYLGKPYYELVRRVLEAETVELEEIKPEK